MAKSYGPGDMVRSRARSGARLTTILVAVLFLALGWIEMSEPDGFPSNTLLLLGLMGLSFVGALVAWWRERLGGMLLKGGAGASGVGWIFSSYLGLGEADLLAATLPLAGISLVAGLLFLVSSYVGDTWS